jgi:hypothetical protein
MRANVKLFVVAGLLVGLALALLVSPFASSSPDGLEKVATEEGFDGSAREHDTADSPLADYGVDGVDNERVGTGLAGVIGVLLTFGIGIGLFAVVRARRPAGRSPAASSGSTA